MSSASSKSPGSPGEPVENAVEVPFDALAPETLRHLAEEFVTRDGTDYGARERSLDEKVEALMRQLASGDAKIFYEQESETINIVATRALRDAAADPADEPPEPDREASD